MVFESLHSNAFDGIQQGSIHFALKLYSLLLTIRDNTNKGIGFEQ